MAELLALAGTGAAIGLAVGFLVLAVAAGNLLGALRYVRQQEAARRTDARPLHQRRDVA